ncbi:MAG TPA: Hsp70 family protein, partial [Gemmataceae bacterium]|nr:Hsp70 family protein [Gemmataceae bacterium]
GILNVTARDQKTGKEVKRQIEQSSGLSNDEVEKMRKDAERFADEDKKKKEFAEESNKADTLVWEVEKTIKEAGDKLAPNDKSALESAVEQVKKARDSHDINGLRNAVNNLQTAAHAMAQQHSRGAGEAPPQGGNAGGGKPGDDVIDAEFEVKK